MWHRRRDTQTTNVSQERLSAPDPVSVSVWHEGHLIGTASTTPVINAPRAGEIAAHEAA